MQFENVYAQMNGIYGEQDHIPTEVLSRVADVWPELFQEIIHLGELVGHLVILPFNERGMVKITDLENDESDFEMDDFELVKNENTPVYFFVYSIFGKNQRFSFRMIQTLFMGMKQNVRIVSPYSFIFAECVSEEGIRISEKLGLRKYHSYNFRGEDIHLYKTSLESFVVHGSRFKGLCREHICN